MEIRMVEKNNISYNYQLVTANAKRRHILECVKRNEGITLRDVYGTYSYAKENAFNYCLDLCCALNGKNFRIVSHNSNVFSVAFDFDDPLTGAPCAMYVARDYNRAVEI